MIHDAAVLDTSGNPAELRDLADDLDRISDNIASMYAAKAGGSVESWRKLMRTETWYTAEQAVTAGLADRILTEDRPPRSAATTCASSPPRAAHAPTESRYPVMSVIPQARVCPRRRRHMHRNRRDHRPPLRRRLR